MRKGFIVLVFLLWAGMAHAQWQFQDLHPTGFNGYSQVLAVIGNQQAGIVSDFSTNNASVWNGTPGSWVSYGDGFLFAMDATQQAGYSLNGSSGPFAAFWRSGVRTFLRQPIGATTSIAYALSGKTYGGYYVGASGNSNAVYWPKAASVVNMHPANYLLSAIFGMYKNVQVGYACPGPYPNCEAAFWKSTPGSFKSLHPAGYYGSVIRGVYNRRGVGWTLDSSGTMHAGFWDIVTGAFTDAHAGDNYQSGINAVYGDSGVGAFQATPGSDWHAMLWDLTNGANNFDLHSVLPVGQYTASSAFAIWRNNSGSIYIGGYATSVTDGQWHAMLWFIP
jgi:hypothetical protein